MARCITHKSEKQFAKQFGAVLESRLEYQYKDIDAWIKSKNRLQEEIKWSVSIKSQEVAQKTGNFSFELVIEDTRTGEWRYGNFMTCKASYAAITDGKEWFIFWTQDLKDFILENKDIYDVKDIAPWRQADNRKQGRKYDNARNMLIPIDDLRELACKIEKVKR